MCFIVNFKVKKSKCGEEQSPAFQSVTMLGLFYFFSVLLSNLLLSPEYPGPYFTLELLHLLL
jgi:hypothetical protein